MPKAIKVNINGREYEREVEPRTLLLPRFSRSFLTFPIIVKLRKEPRRCQKRSR